MVQKGILIANYKRYIENHKIQVKIKLKKVRVNELTFCERYSIISSLDEIGKGTGEINEHILHKNIHKGTE